MLFLSRVIVSITINVQTVGGSNLIESIFSSLGLFLYLTVFSLPLFVLHKSHPEASLLQITENNCGRGVSVPMSAIYALYFIVMNIFSLSLFLTLLVNTTDPVASRFSIVLVVLGIALYGAIRGIETISRASVCIFTLFMLGMGMIFLAVSPNVTPHYLMPLFYDGIDQTVQGFLVFTARCSSLAEFAVLMPFLTNTDTKSGKSHRVLGFVVWNGGITVFLGVLLFFIVSCLGEYAALQVFPAYTLASIAEIAGIQRLDALFIGISMMALIVRIACGLFCIAVCMTPIPTRPRAWLTALIAALTAVLSLWLTDSAARVGAVFRTAYLLPLSVLTGASKGPAIGHISPEAAQGGPIALIEENDLIEIDIPQRILCVVGINGEKCSEEEVQRVFNERRKALPPFKSRYTHGVLKRFTQTAHSPMQGGYMD